MFAVLAPSDAEDDAEDDDAIRVDRGHPSRASSDDDDDASTSSSSSGADQDGEPSATLTWRWSTGRADDDDGRWRTNHSSSTRSASARARALMPGEKKMLKKLHVAATRATRARRDGFDANDARREMERVVREGKSLTIVCSKRACVARGQGRVIRALAAALGTTFRPTRAGKRAAFVIERVDGTSDVPPVVSEELLKSLCAEPMTRDEYLMSDERRARLEKRAEASRRANKGKKKKDRGRRWNRKSDEEDTTRDIVDFTRATEDEATFDEDAARRAPSPLSGAFAAFEAHTRGIGSRLLTAMGFTRGSGLGRDNQGIAEAPRAESRAKRAGLGAE
jgi:hypothetical protein